MSSGVRMTTEQFIEKARSIHGDRYDYSKVEYVNTHTKVTIVCREHGVFWQSARHHFAGRGRGCRKCFDTTTGDRFRASLQGFIEKSQKVHGDKYDYSKVEYINCRSKVCIICPEHGEFWQTSNSHVTGGCGCPVCARPNSVIYIALGIHGDVNRQKKYRRKNDIKYRLKLNMVIRFRNWLRVTNAPKVGSITARLQEYIMMDRNSFVSYYESLFQPEMNWQNTHIDHHIPLSYFDPTSEEDMKIAWNWYNLRPLLGEDNRSKSATLPDDYENVLATIKEIIEYKITDPEDLVFDLRLIRDTPRRK